MDVPTIGDLIYWFKFALELIKKLFALFKGSDEDETTTQAEEDTTV